MSHLFSGQSSTHVPAIVFAWLIAHSAAMGAIVYDNSNSFQGMVHNSRLEYGDEISLAGTERSFLRFSFEYYASFEPSGTEAARLRFYDASDGTAGLSVLR